MKYFVIVRYHENVRDNPVYFSGDRSDIVIGGDTVNTNQPGIYYITYNVTQAEVPAVEVIRTVIVEESESGPMDDQILEDAMDAITELLVSNSTNRNADASKPTINLPSNSDGIVYSFSSTTATGNQARIDLETGIVTRHNSTRTETLTLHAKLNESTLTKIFTVVIPATNHNSTPGAIVVSSN